MGYVILRTDKLKSAIAVKRSLQHAFRAQDTPNADPARTPNNVHIGAANVGEALARFNSRLATQAKVRSNAVLAIEYLVSCSPDDMRRKTPHQQNAYFRDALKWLQDKHGAENVIYAGIHRDETTPHMYAYVVPIDQRGKLNCRSFLGGAKTVLSQMQTDFAQEVGQKHGLERGIQGSKARHVTMQQYYRRVNEAFETLPEVVTPRPSLRPEPEKPGLFAGSKARESYRKNHDAWQREKAAAEKQWKQHSAEIRSRSDRAIEIATRHQAQAREAAALKAQVVQLKRSNSHYVTKSNELATQLGKVSDIANLLLPREIQALQERKRRRDEAQTKEAQKAALAATRPSHEGDSRANEALPAPR